MKFKIGDRVRCIHHGGRKGSMLTIGPRADLTGTIIYDNECGGCWYGVCFDGGFEGGHDFMGMIGTPTGWWCYGNALELIEPVEDSAIDVDLEEVL